MTSIRFTFFGLRFFSCIVVLLLSTAALNARAALTIEITGGATLQIPVAIAPFAGEEAYPDRLSKIVMDDLARSGLFKLIDTGGMTPPRVPTDVRVADWRAKGATALAMANVVPQAGGRLEVQFRLLDMVRQDVAQVVQLAGYSLPTSSAQLRLTAHQIADIIFEKLTGNPGAFASRIAYITKRGSTHELQIADSDGFNAQTIFSSREPIISPAWSPDGTKLAYVAFDQKKPTVYVQTLATGQRQTVANFKGNNSAPAWSPDGRQLALVLSRDGYSQIYSLNADGSAVKRLTHSTSIDTEPNWSPDGRYLLFTSDRGGSPQIYRMPANGGEAARLTFEGGYNVTPRYSPDGKSFAFIQRESGKFRVAIQDVATGQVQVLTDNALDESPSWAPNGKMILYATETLGRGVLAAVSSDGRVKQKLSTQAGEVREPAWGPLLKARP